MATKAGVDHSLLPSWLTKYRLGELSLRLQREEQLVATEQRLAELERNVGQLTMELDL